MTATFWGPIYTRRENFYYHKVWKRLMMETLCEGGGGAIGGLYDYKNLADPRGRPFMQGEERAL